MAKECSVAAVEWFFMTPELGGMVAERDFPAAER